MLSYKTLDDVLAVLEQTTSSNPIPSSEIFKNFPNLQNNQHHRDRRAILDKLQYDEFVGCLKSVFIIHRFPDDLPLYFISFNGLLLLQDEGYVGRRKKEKFSKFLQLSLTIMIAIGTLAAAAFSGILVLGKK